MTDTPLRRKFTSANFRRNGRCIYVGNPKRSDSNNPESRIILNTGDSLTMDRLITVDSEVCVIRNRGERFVLSFDELAPEPEPPPA